MRWLALHLPQLSLETFVATLSPAQRSQPVALLAGHRIAAVNDEAALRGIRPGQKRATALALVADLVVGQADAARDAQALQAVVHVALAYTPLVTLDAGHPTVLLELQASLRLFGGLPRLLQHLQGALAPLQHAVARACAPTAAGAALLARWQAVPASPPGPSGGGGGPAASVLLGSHGHDVEALRKRLDAAPLWLLDAAGAHGETLQGMGLSTLGDLRRVPRAGLARRVGDALLDDLDRVLGHRHDPRVALQPPPVFDSRLELYARADRTEQVLHGAAVLLARLVAWAQARFARVAAFTLTMAHERRHRDDDATPACTALEVRLAEPSCDAAHLQVLLRERLAHCVLPAPTLELHLHCDRPVQRAPPNGELFPTREGEREGWAQLLERLRARLGDGQVLQLTSRPDHRPERASHWQAAAAPFASAAGEAAPTATALPQHRPVWLLDPPQPLPEQRSVPCLDGQALQLLCGPERIETGWWDGGLAARDYFIAQAGDGALVWVYRTRLPPLDTADECDGWFLHGRFG